jgi:polar amino acid transport system ATP-binding protein
LGSTTATDGANSVLQGISLDAAKGETTRTVGPSGSGNTVLIQRITTPAPINSGSIQVQGIEVKDPNLDKHQLRRRIGITLEQHDLLPRGIAQILPRLIPTGGLPLLWR